MKKNPSNKLKTQRALSLVVFLVGVILMVFMSLVEDELGGIPLLLISFGLGFFIKAQLQLRALTKK